MGAEQSKRLFPEGVQQAPSWLPEVLSFGSWQDRAAIISTSRRTAITRDDMLYRYFCTLLRKESGLYIPVSLPSSDRSWKNVFMEYYRARDLWSAVPEPEEGEEDAALWRRSNQAIKTERFRVNVYARFRPMNEEEAQAKKDKLDKLKEERRENGEAEEEEDAMPKCVLPLHQRLSMIRMANQGSGSKGMSKREALRVLASEGDWFGKKFKMINKNETGKIKDKENSSKENTNNQRQGTTNTDVIDMDLNLGFGGVSALLRKGEKPLQFQKVKREQTVSKVQSVDPNMARVVMMAPDVGLREFSFDGVVAAAKPGHDNASTQQEKVYDLVCKRLVMDFLNGFNGTCIAYGQTASGKTYTMVGPDGVLESITHHQGKIEGQKGIVPRACEEVLAFVADSDGSRAKLGLRSELAVSYVEIYGDTVTDLLKGGARVGHSKVAAQRFVLSGAVENPVRSLDEVHACLQQGDGHRRRAATAMNDRSSRAHALFILTLRRR